VRAWIKELDRHPDLPHDLEQCRQAVGRGNDLGVLLDGLLLSEAITAISSRLPPEAITAINSQLLPEQIWGELWLWLSAVDSPLSIDSEVERAAQGSMEWLLSRYFEVWVRGPLQNGLVPPVLIAAICTGTWRDGYRIIRSELNRLNDTQSLIQMALYGDARLGKLLWQNHELPSPTSTLQLALLAFLLTDMRPLLLLIAPGASKQVGQQMFNSAWTVLDKVQGLPPGARSRGSQTEYANLMTIYRAWRTSGLSVNAFLDAITQGKITIPHWSRRPQGLPSVKTMRKQLRTARRWFAPSDTVPAMLNDYLDNERPTG